MDQTQRPDAPGGGPAGVPAAGDVPHDDVPAAVPPSGGPSVRDVPAGNVPDEGLPGAVGPAADVPDEGTLAATATPATVRRAPKISAFITVGVLLGLVIGWVVGLLGTGTTGEGRTGAVLLTTLGFVVLGAILASGLAAIADRRSVRRRRGPGAGPAERA